MWSSGCDSYQVLMFLKRFNGEDSNEQSDAESLSHESLCWNEKNRTEKMQCTIDLAKWCAPFEGKILKRTDVCEFHNLET